MRKLLITLILLLAFTKISAQTFLLDTPQIYIGTTQGATASMLYFSPNVKQDILFGYNGGFLFRYVTEKGRSLQVELNYSQRGWSEKDGIYARRLHYLELPFLMHMYWGNKTRFFVNLGPKASYLLGETVLHDKTESDKEQYTHKIHNAFDYGVTAGLGLEFAVKEQLFQFETRAHFSLNTTFSNNKKNTYNYSNNMNLSVNLAWLLRVNKDK